MYPAMRFLPRLHRHLRRHPALRAFSSVPSEAEQNVQISLHQPPSAPLDVVAPESESLLSVAQANSLNLGDTCDATCLCTSCVVHIPKAVAHRLPAPTTAEQALLNSLPPALLSASPDPAPGGGPAAQMPAHVTRLSCMIPAGAVSNEVVRFPSPTGEALLDSAPSKASSPAAVRAEIEPMHFRPYSKSAIRGILEKYALTNRVLRDNVSELELVANILPFRTNNYVIEQLIDWSAVPNDPIFQLTFPQPGMLPESAEKHHLRTLLQSDPSKYRASAVTIRAAADAVRKTLNPHPAKQAVMNVPFAQDGQALPGVQHKYTQTVLFFPADAQYCHAYCTYCFRWAQFVGWEDAQFATDDIDSIADYLARNEHVTDVLITGGDPMVLHPRRLEHYLHVLANDPRLRHVQNIRIGSKSLTYWPYKFVTDPGAPSVLRTLERTVDAGKHVALMAHFTHPAELRTPVLREAVRRIRKTGVNIRCQAPMVRGINDDADTLASMWREQVAMGMIPYYTFVERDTGPQDWFAVPLARALRVYQDAIRQVSGLARTVRGPSMSCTPGKVCVTGVEEVAGERVFVLRFLQARNQEWNDRVFFAAYDEEARWMDELRPAFGESKFFFEDELEEMEAAARSGLRSSGQQSASDTAVAV